MMDLPGVLRSGDWRRTGPWAISIAAAVLVASAAVASQADDPVATGARIYAEVCQTCHGPDGSGLAQFQGNLDDLRSILSGRTNRMPDFYGVFSDEEIAAIYAYVRAQ